MQTFLPYADFARSAACLDRQRLGKQRVECKQILTALRTGGGWSNHPATKMWRNHPNALERYGWFMVQEWISRGYKNTMEFRYMSEKQNPNPTWLGDERFHSSHRAALLYKAPLWYGTFGWTEEPGLNYVWPGIGGNT